MRSLFTAAIPSTTENASAVNTAVAPAAGRPKRTKPGSRRASPTPTVAPMLAAATSPSCACRRTKAACHASFATPNASAAASTQSGFTRGSPHTAAAAVTAKAPAVSSVEPSTQPCRAALPIRSAQPDHVPMRTYGNATPRNSPVTPVAATSRQAATAGSGVSGSGSGSGEGFMGACRIANPRTVNVSGAEHPRSADSSSAGCPAALTPTTGAIASFRPPQGLHPKGTTMPINLSETATKEIKSIIDSQELDGETVKLRVGVKGGGCSGFSYLLDLTETQRDNDEEFEVEGLRVVCDPKSYLYLNGTNIDFKDEVMGRGFVFNNPNATSTCGCGSSFSA